MKCEEFIDRSDCLSAADIPQDMKEHMAECDECREYYSVISALEPKVFPETPGSIKANVLKRATRKEISKTDIKMRTKILRASVSVAAAAAIVIGLTLTGNLNQARAAERIIDKSLSAVGNVKNMVMKIDVRTTQKENFSSIDINGPMVEHTLTVIRDNNVWRLDKGWRCIVFDGKSKYMWTPDGSMKVKGGEGAGFEEWFAFLLDPEMTLLVEKVATKDKGSNYSIEESGDDIIIRANVKAQGDFTNPYLRNTSIEEADTRREVVFDKNTELLKGMKIYVEHNFRKILIVDIKSVEYDVADLDEAGLTAIPEGIEWRDVDAKVVSDGTFAGITPEKAAEMVFDALEKNDAEAVKAAFRQYDLNTVFGRYGGLEVIKLGKAFRSGSYPGVFVPYKIKLADGKIKKHNLALRNDNPEREWIVDGGI